MGSHTRDVLKETRETLVAKRRKAYKKNKWEKYEDIVSSIIKLEDKTATDILKLVLSQLGIQE